MDSEDSRYEVWLSREGGDRHVLCTNVPLADNVKTTAPSKIDRTIDPNRILSSRECNERESASWSHEAAVSSSRIRMIHTQFIQQWTITALHQLRFDFYLSVIKYTFSPLPNATSLVPNRIDATLLFMVLTRPASFIT